MINNDGFFGISNYSRAFSENGVDDSRALVGRINERSTQLMMSVQMGVLGR